MATVQLQSVRKEFHARRQHAVAIDSLNLDIQDGEFVSLVGPSGCGKTTTLRIVAGLETATSGRLLFDGVDVSKIPVQDRDISMVFQNYAIFPHMTVAQNIGYGLRIARVSKEERLAGVQRAAALVGISDLVDRYPKELSGGQRQRVALARALARTPGLILMDEPLSNLDAKLREETRAELKLLHRRLQNTVIYVTHDQLEAVTLSDRMAVMNRGVLQQFDTPEAIFAAPANAFVAGFIGSPSMNLVPGEVTSPGQQAGVTVAGQSLPTTSQVAHTGPVTVGIRPQHISVRRCAGVAPVAWRVTVIEPLGTEVIVHLHREDVQLKALRPAPLHLSEGDCVEIDVDPSCIHLFDTEAQRLPSTLSESDRRLTAKG